MTFAPKVGLPGRVWASRQSVWIRDVQEDPNLPRLPAARKVGLHGAFCFRIPAAGGVIGFMSFFSAEVAEPDTAVLAMMDAIGTQIGQFVERTLAHEHIAQRALALGEAQRRPEQDFAERTEASRRRMAQHAATRALEESGSLDDAAPSILRSICEALGWAWLALWVVDRDPDVRALREVAFYSTSEDFSSFEELSRGTSFRIQELMEAYERLMDEHGLVKMKSIGPGLLAVCGLQRAERNPVLHAAACAQEMRDAVARICDSWSVRIGIHVGAVTAGLLGRKRFHYDVWGDTVDLAARLYHHARPGAIVLSDTARIAVTRYGEFAPVALGGAEHAASARGKADGRCRGVFNFL